MKTCHACRTTRPLDEFPPNRARADGRHCGEDDHVVLTFDHVRGEKSFTISDRLHTMTWTGLSREIAKCDVVCANCHLRRTARRGGYYLDLA